MTKGQKIKRWTINIALFLADTIIMVLSFPAYVYAFGKVLCDKDEINEFYESLWETMMGLKDVSDVKIGARQFHRQNERLKQYIEDIKNAADKTPENTSAKYNATWDVIYKYNEEFSIKDE